MGRGGTRAGAGRPPDPESLRQAKARERGALDRVETYGEWIELPKSARRGRVPAWPLPTATNAAERKLWNRLWKSPQAIRWEHDGQEMQVALYVRRSLEAEERGAPSSLTSVVLRLADSLGISELGMRSLRWRIVDREAASTAKAATDAPTVRRSTGSSKQRLTVVRDDAGA